MERTNLARRIAVAVTIFVFIAAFLALLAWEDTKAFIQRNDALFKLIGLAVGPFLAVLGFIWGLLDKAELKDLSEELGRAHQKAEDEQRAAAEAEQKAAATLNQVKALERDLATIANAGRLWKLRKNAPFGEYEAWKARTEGAKIVTIGLFKGGVGKTHLTANFAAYVSEKQQKPVLLIDLDYQGSLSSIVLPAAGIEPSGSKVDKLLSVNANLATLSGQRMQLAPNGASVTLNDGNGLARCWIVPADYTLAEVESCLLIERVMRQDENVLDERYRLPHLLLNPDVRHEYAMIIIDTPPRMTLGTVNALVASHSYIVPTILDRVSSEAVRPFLSQIETLKTDLSLNLKLAGFVASMTREKDLSASEEKYRDQIVATAEEVLGPCPDIFVKQNLPKKAAITNGDDLGYFLSDRVGPLRRFYDPLFEELWTRVMDL